MGLGVTWTTYIDYDYDVSMSKIVKRNEYNAVAAAYPDLDARIAERWKQLRQKELSEENVRNLLETQIDLVTSSGSIDRDHAKWGLKYEGKDDSHAAVLRFVQERLQKLDEYYS